METRADIQCTTDDMMRYMYLYYTTEYMLVASIDQNNNFMYNSELEFKWPFEQYKK